VYHYEQPNSFLYYGEEQKMNKKKFVAAAVQVAPELPMNKAKTVDKVCDIIAEAAKAGAELIVFPECFVPMYPNWSIDLQNPNEWVYNLRDLTEHAMIVPGPETDKIGRVIREFGVHVVLGINESVLQFDGALYNTIVFFGPDGSITGKHRKIFPSNREKVFHGRGDASGLNVYDTSIGRIGGLICYEHLQPLLKYSLISQGEQIHCAVWNGWPNNKGGRSNITPIDASMRTYALEGSCFVVFSSFYVPESMQDQAGLGNADWSFFGGSGIINPSGEYIVGPIYDKEDIAYGEIDLSLIPLRKAAQDTTGRDTASYLMNVNIDRTSYEPVNWGHPGKSNELNELKAKYEEMAKQMEELNAKLKK
jgi:nitrilase